MFSFTFIFTIDNNYVFFTLTTKEQHNFVVNFVLLATRRTFSSFSTIFFRAAGFQYFHGIFLACASVKKQMHLSIRNKNILEIKLMNIFIGSKLSRFVIETKIHHSFIHSFIHSFFGSFFFFFFFVHSLFRSFRCLFVRSFIII